MGKRLNNCGKYNLRQHSHGLVIDAPDRQQVEVELRATHFRVWCGDDQPERIGLVEYQRMLTSVAWGLMRDWTPPRQDRKPWPGIKSWAVGNTRRSIAGPLHGHWCRLLEKIDPKIIRVQKAIFSATFGLPRIVFSEAFYREPYLVQDVINHRAAAIATRHAESLIRKKRQCQNLQLPAIAASIGFDIGAIEDGTQIDHLRQWPQLFSKDDAYKSLRRTLIQLPGGIASHLLINLPDLRLIRPIRKRVELSTLLLAVEQENQTNQDIFQIADETRIRAAMDLVGQALGRRLNWRSTMDISWFVEQLADYPDRHRGNIIGLAKKTLGRQRDQSTEQINRVIRDFGSKTSVMLPPVALPTDPEIRFLGTPAEIFEEGAVMDHCVQRLIPYAIDGKAFLFHVEKYQSTATVQVDALGEVRQSRGPSNCSNRACQWGARILRRWGESFPRPNT